MLNASCLGKVVLVMILDTSNPDGIEAGSQGQSRDPGPANCREVPRFGQRSIVILSFEVHCPVPGAL
jgi:hypothetical protein